MTLEEEIAEAERELNRASWALDGAQKQLNALYVQRASEKYKIAPGMTVRSGNRYFIIDGIRPSSWDHGQPWLYGRPIKKDGTPGSRSQTIFREWEVVEDARR